MSFCNAPFVQLTLLPSGHASPCCYHQGIRIDCKNAQSIDDIWNSAKMQKLRQEFLSGDIRSCRSRMQNLSCFKEFERWDSWVEKEAIQKSPPKRLDVRLNGHCNLECIMCDVWQQPNGLYDQNFFWQEGPEKIFPYLKEIDILGGEPFVQQDTFKLIDAIFQVNPHCQFSFVTNGQYVVSARLHKILNAISIRMLQVSLDSLEKNTYENIRRKGTLDVVLKSIDFFSSLKAQKRFEFKISMCIQRENWRETENFLKFCVEKQAKPEFQMAFYDPSDKSSMRHASVDELNQAIEYFENIEKHYPFSWSVSAVLRRFLERFYFLSSNPAGASFEI